MDTLHPFGGFKKLRHVDVDRFLRSIDWGTEMLLCHPLAHPHLESTNPVYDCRPADAGALGAGKKVPDIGVVDNYKQGLIIRGFIETDILRDTSFLCAEVELDEISTGWINIAMRKTDLSDPRWLMYCALQVVSRCRCRDCNVEWLKNGWRCYQVERRQ